MMVKSTPERRREQNRLAQRRFRARQEAELNELQQQVLHLQRTSENAQAHLKIQTQLIHDLRMENKRLSDTPSEANPLSIITAFLPEPAIPTFDSYSPLSSMDSSISGIAFMHGTYLPENDHPGGAHGRNIYQADHTLKHWFPISMDYACMPPIFDKKQAVLPMLPSIFITPPSSASISSPSPNQNLHSQLAQNSSSDHFSGWESFVNTF